VDEVILVGGATRTPGAGGGPEVLRERAPQGVNPDEVVAVARRSGRRARGDVKDVLLLDVTRSRSVSRRWAA